jgi:hypothetical protein
MNGSVRCLQCLLVSEQGLTTAEVVHDGCKDVGLQHRPVVVVRLGHRHKVAAKKHTWAGDEGGVNCIGFSKPAKGW